MNSIFSEICDYNNLRCAYLKALKGKRNTPAAILFSKDADGKLKKLKNDLENKTYKIGQYRQFKIYDPKERLITAATFEDRIVHHAIINIMEKVFERQFIFHTYACRKKKGSQKAIYYCHKKTRTSKYCLKLDFRKYFDSVSHDILKNLLKRIIKDEECLNLLYSIIDSYEVTKGKGLPIGNLTSQYYANFFLSGLDHYVTDILKPKGYVRYMDDILVFSDSKSELRSIFLSMKEYAQKLNLEFKLPIMAACKNGVPFLGYLVKRNSISLLIKGKKRKLRKMKKLEHEFNEGKISENEFVTRLNSIQNVFEAKIPENQECLGVKIPENPECLGAKFPENPECFESLHQHSRDWRGRERSERVGSGQACLHTEH